MNHPTPDSIKKTVRFAMSPEQALELARHLTAEAHRVIEAQKEGSQWAYAYVGTSPHPENGSLRIRIGKTEA